MSFLDRIRNNDKQEVELDPDRHVEQSSSPQRSTGQEQEEVELGATDEDRSDSGGGSFLPGTGAETDETTDTPSRTDKSRSSRRRSGDAGDDRLDKVLQQNERIIELLEEIAQINDDSSTDRSTGSQNDELW